MAHEVTLDGKKYLYRFDMGTLLNYEEFSDNISKELQTPRRMSMVMHYACLLDNEDFDMTFPEFCRAVNTAEVAEALAEANAEEVKRWQARNQPRSGSEKKK